MTDEYRQALKELRRTENNLKEVDKKYHGVALLEYETAKARVDALIKEAKEVLRDERNIRECSKSDNTRTSNVDV